MKKDKEWLKEEIKKMGLISSGSLFRLIDELDNQEVLSQEWIEEHKYNHYIGKPFVYVNDLQNLIVPKQDKPVIPQFVADWYEENLSGGYTNNRNKFSGNDVFRVIQDVLKTSEGLKTWGDYGIDKEITAWAEENEEDFIYLIANCSYKDGYEIEQEKRYYIVEKINNSTLMTFELSDVVGEEVIEFVYGYSENETIHFNSKEKAELIAHFVGESLEVEEVTE